MDRPLIDSDIRDELLHNFNGFKLDGDRFLIYILPGNPGLISFYEPFAVALKRELQQLPATSELTAIIGGKSYRGFEISSADLSAAKGPLGLAETVVTAEDDLESLVGSLPATAKKTKIILLGHSVGAYIVMELLRRQAERDKREEIDIIGGIMVCPTITHVAKSRTGRILSPILNIPSFATVVATFAALLVSKLSFDSLYQLARLLTRFPPPATITVTHFLRSKNGVRQALWLGKEEMKIITEDKWQDNVWGSGLPTDPALFMYFAENDPYVPKWAQEDLIATRGQTPSTGQLNPQGDKIRVTIDKNKLPHCWCIEHGPYIAGIVAPVIGDMISRHKT